MTQVQLPDFAPALERLRRRRVLHSLSVLLGIPAVLLLTAVVVTLLGLEGAALRTITGFSVAGLWLLVASRMEHRVRQSRCPRCQEPFHVAPSPAPRVRMTHRHSNICLHCGLSHAGLQVSRVTPNEELKPGGTY